MKKLTLSILFLLFLASFCVAQTCDCKIVPYNPASCFKTCTASVLVDAALEELLLIIGVNKETAEKIIGYNKDKKAKSIDDYSSVLSEAELKKLEEKLQSLDESQVAYFQQPIKEREDERKALKEINKRLDRLGNVSLIGLSNRDQ